MYSFLEAMGDIFGFCWDIWQYRFNIGDSLSFTLANVAEVAVIVWIGAKLLGCVLDGEWGE